MPNKLKLSTKDESFNEIFSNGKKYLVPRFQRDYSWDKENWMDLWEDINNLYTSQEDYHYMGYLVFQETEDINFKVIDGQQRLTTFSLLILAAIKRLRELGNEDDRIQQIFKNYIGDKDLIDLKVENKLNLNRNNDYYYRELVSGKEIPKRKIKKTVNLMGKAQDYFYERFCKLSGSVEISKIIRTLGQKTLFTAIYIGDELNAYKVFETLNARGVKLSSADLLKNYLFSLIDPSSKTPDEVLDRLDQKWEKIGANISDKEGYSQYILTQWNSNHPLVRKSELFKRIKKEVNDPKKAQDFLDTLEKHSQIYGALLNPTDEFWKDLNQNPTIEKDLRFLSLFNIIQPQSLLMAACANISQDFHKLLSWIKVLSLRYNVIGREHTGEQEKFYNKICLDISKGCKLSDIKTKILKFCPDDEKFERAFAEKSIPTGTSNKRARYLLARLEDHAKTTKIDETSLTVEHILPLNPDNDWEKYFGDDWKYFNERLGNMALVDNKTNKDLGQKTFEEKKKILLETPHYINKNMEGYEDWDSDSIKSRQEKMAEHAIRAWRIP